MVGPVDSDERTEMRSGFTRTDDEVHPGDTIEWPVALDSGQRGREDFAVHDEIERMDPVPLDVCEGDWNDTENEICAFCNAPQHIRERGGAMKADYELRNPDGVLVALSCHACIAQAETVDS